VPSEAPGVPLIPARLPSRSAKSAKWAIRTCSIQIRRSRRHARLDALSRPDGEGGRRQILSLSKCYHYQRGDHCQFRFGATPGMPTGITVTVHLINNRPYVRHDAAWAALPASSSPASHTASPSVAMGPDHGRSSSTTTMRSCATCSPPLVRRPRSQSRAGAWCRSTN
jgi:hypothetical protein